MTEEKNDVYLAAGKIIVFSSGEYSDYGYSGMYVTLRPLLRSHLNDIAKQTAAEGAALEAELDTYHNTPVAERGPYPGYPNLHEMFQSRLIALGLLMVIDYAELHAGSYGRLEVSL